MSERNIIEVETVFEIKDFWRYYFSQYFSFIHILFNTLGYTIFGWCIAFLFLRGNIEFLHLVDIIIGAVFFSFFVSFISAYLAIRNVKKFEGQKCKYTFTNEKVEIMADLSRSSVDWKNFYRVKETSKYFVLFVKNGEQYFIPKRFFQNEELADFKNLVHAKFGEEAYLKKSKEKLGLK